MISTMLTMSIMGIVVVSPPPPPATASQQNCKYSIRESYDTYVCYSETEYSQLMAQKQAEADKSAAELKNNMMWLVGHWWQTLISIVGALVVIIVLWMINDAIQMKRHPERYDQYGFRIGDWW